MSILSDVTFWELLQRRITTDGARPLLTCYDAEGGRTELSAITYGNWVAKAANLIVDEIDAGTGDRIGLPLLGRNPGHWMGLVWAGACWTAGAEACPYVGDDMVAVVSGPELDFDGATTLRYAVSLHPLGLGFSGQLPEGVADWASEVRSQPDVFLGVPPMADDLAWDGEDQAQLTAGTPVAERVLVDLRDGNGPEPRTLLHQVLIGPLLAGGSSVVVLSGDAERIATAERAIR